MSDIIPTYPIHSFTAETFLADAPYIHVPELKGYVRQAHVAIPGEHKPRIAVITQTAEQVGISLPESDYNAGVLFFLSATCELIRMTEHKPARRLVCDADLEKLQGGAQA